MFAPSHPLLWQIGEPASLGGKNKLYFADWRGTRQPPSNFLPKGNTFFYQRPLNPHFPLALKGSPLSISLSIGNEAFSGTASGPRPKVTAELWIQPAPAAASLTVTCNGQLLDRGTVANDRLRFALDPALIKQGVNVFAVRRPEAIGTHPVFLKDIMLSIVYADGP